MHVTDKIRKNQQKRIADQICATDSCSFFNLLTGPEPLEFVDTQLPEHRERLYPPTVTLSLFVTQALLSDGSCQNAVNGYHVTLPGDRRREPIYDDDRDRETFLSVLANVIEHRGWLCHAYCLMTNHYHLLIETPEANLARGMRQLNGV
ncbi:MAG: transposase, partial [Gammaproteobacteria bacterium]